MSITGKNIERSVGVGVVFRNSAIYSIMKMLQMGTGLVLLPIYTSYLSPGDLGITGIAESTLWLLQILYSLGLNDAVSRFYYKYHQEKKDFGRLLGTVYGLILIASVVFSVTFWLCREPLARYVFTDIPLWPYIVVTVFAVMFSPYYMIFESYLKVQHRAFEASCNDFVFFLSRAGLTILLIVVFDWRAMGVIAAIAATFMLFTFYAWIRIAFEQKLRFARELVKPLLKFSMPLVPNNLSIWLTTALSLFMLNSMVSSDEAGLFNIANIIHNATMSLLLISVLLAYNPWFFQQMEQHGDRKKVAELSQLIVMMLTLSGFMIALWAPDIFRVLARKEFFYAWKITPILVFSGVFYSQFQIVTGVFMLKNTNYLVVLTGAGAVVAIVANWLLIPYFGVFGAAFSAVIARVLVGLGGALWAKKISGIDYRVWSLFGLGIVFWVAALSVYWLSEQPWYLNYGGRLALSLCGITVIAMMVQRHLGAVLRMLTAKMAGCKILVR